VTSLSAMLRALAVGWAWVCDYKCTCSSVQKSVWISQ